MGAHSSSSFLDECVDSSKKYMGAHSSSSFDAHLPLRAARHCDRTAFVEKTRAHASPKGSRSLGGQKRSNPLEIWPPGGPFGGQNHSRFSLTAVGATLSSFLDECVDSSKKYMGAHSNASIRRKNTWVPKWSPGGPNGAQEAQMEPRMPKWSARGPNGAQKAQMEPRMPRRPKWSPGGPNGAQAQSEQQASKVSPKHNR